MLFIHIVDINMIQTHESLILVSSGDVPEGQKTTSGRWSVNNPKHDAAHNCTDAVSKWRQNEPHHRFLFVPSNMFSFKVSLINWCCNTVISTALPNCSISPSQSIIAPILGWGRKKTSSGNNRMRAKVGLHRWLWPPTNRRTSFASSNLKVQQQGNGHCHEGRWGALGTSAFCFRSNAMLSNEMMYSIVFNAL